MSETIMVIATVFIAIFSGLTWNVSQQLKRDSVTRQAEIKGLFIKLVTGIMASGKTAGEPKFAASIFIEHEIALRKELDKIR